MVLTNQKAREKRSRYVDYRCDYHPAFQQIAFVDTDTGELQEGRLQHREEAEKFYRDLAVQGMKVRVGMEASGHARSGCCNVEPNILFPVHEGAPFRRWWCLRSQPTPKGAPFYNAITSTIHIELSQA